MKHRTSFILKGLVSLVLSLVMLCGTAVTSLSAVTDDIVAAVQEPVRSAIPDACAPAQATTHTEILPQCESDEIPYAVAQSSLDAVPEDDEVLDVDLQASDDSQEKPALSRKADVDLAATGAQVTGSLETSQTYYLISEGSDYMIDYSGGWRVKNSSGQYLSLTGNRVSWGSSATAFTVSYNSGFYFKSGNFYLSYSNSSFGAAAQQAAATAFSVYETSVTPTEAATEAPTEAATEAATEAPVAANTLYFTCPSGWNYLKAYMWKGDTKNANFPGTTLTYVEQNSNNEAVYSIEADPSVYENIIFSNTNTDGGNTTAYAQTVTLSIEDLLANGAGVYCYKTNATDYAVDGEGHLQVNCYTYGDSSSTGDSETITYSKQIEKKNPNNNDDYNYRLHLNVDGTALNDIQVTPGGDPKGLSGALIIDVTDTMAATWTGSGSDVKKGEQAFQAIYDSNSFLGQFLAVNENNQLTVIGMRGDDQSDYDDENQSVLINGWADTVSKSFSNYQRNGREPNYIASLLRAKDQFASATATNDQAIIFITGNAPKYVSNNDGTSKGRAYDHAANAETDTKNFIDWFFQQNPNISIYVVGMEAFGSGDNTVAKYMGDQSVEVTGKGGYFAVTNLNDMKDVLNNTILPDVIVSGDKTSDITVTDTLSQYVDFASNKNLTAMLYTSLDNGSWTTSTDVSSEVSYNGKTVTFSRAAEIEGPFKLEIAFDIKTTDGVYTDTATYGSSGYPNEGDSNTDYTTATSAGQRGYYANSSATIGYTLNGAAVSGVFIKPVVQAPATAPVQGSYIFKYYDRYDDLQEVTVPVTLNSSEISGYSGNNNHAGVPTFLWTSEAQTLFSNVNPLVTAALALEGNDNWQKDASVYKNDLVWDNLVATTQGSNITYDAEAHTLTVTAATTPYTFTLMYYSVSGGTATHQGTASGLVYGKAVTFNPIYSGSTEYSYVNYTVPSDGFSYWSADEAGTIPITTNLTYGMIMRGDYTDDGDNDRTVRIYAQYNKTISAAWQPLIEEVKLTRTIDDDHDWVYLDYMTNYLSQAGTVVQEMETKPEYGIVVAKYDSAQSALTKAKMESVANAMITGKMSSAYLNREKTAIAYRFNYSDNEHISDFNRVLYTLKSDTEKAENKQFTAIAYIVVDGTTYYSPINTDITVIDLV